MAKSSGEKSTLPRPTHCLQDPLSRHFWVLQIHIYTLTCSPCLNPLLSSPSTHLSILLSLFPQTHQVIRQNFIFTQRASSSLFFPCLIFTIFTAIIVMSMILFQDFQSCLDTQLAEQRTLRLKTDPAISPLSQLLEIDIKSSNSEHIDDKKSQFSSSPDSGPWSFSQALSDCFFTSCPNPSEGTMNGARPYIHPQPQPQPQPMYPLSARSLELCTETLGNETGSDVIVEDCIPTLPPTPNVENSRARRQRSGKRQQSISSRNFPPPLTTISGSESIQIRPHREGGRVVMKAVVAPTTHLFLKAERSHGRLRLCFLKNYSTSEFDDSEEAETAAAAAATTEEIENGGDSEGASSANEENETEEEVECDACLRAREDMDEINLEFGVEMGMDKFRRPQRCQGRCGRNEKLLNWESFSVATS